VKAVWRTSEQPLTGSAGILAGEFLLPAWDSPAGMPALPGGNRITSQMLSRLLAAFRSLTPIMRNPAKTRFATASKPRMSFPFTIKILYLG